MDTPSTDWQCKESVPNKFSVTFRRCSFKAWKDGYCKIHHPDSVKARQEKQRLKYEEERAKSPFMLLKKASERNQQLERELAAEQEKVKELREALAQMTDEVCKYCYAPGFDQMGAYVTNARAILEKTK